jgi:hypothetical protein
MAAFALYQTGTFVLFGAVGVDRDDVRVGPSLPPRATCFRLVVFFLQVRVCMCLHVFACVLHVCVWSLRLQRTVQWRLYVVEAVVEVLGVRP